MTGRSGDGGIDGAGVLRVNLISFHVAAPGARAPGAATWKRRRTPQGRYRLRHAVAAPPRRRSRGPEPFLGRARDRCPPNAVKGPRGSRRAADRELSTGSRPENARLTRILERLTGEHLWISRQGHASGHPHQNVLHVMCALPQKPNRSRPDDPVSQRPTRRQTP